MNRILRTLRTVRHLQRRQIYWQLRNRLLRPWTHLPTEARSGSWQFVEPPDRTALCAERWSSLPAPVPLQSREQLLSGTFSFLNDCRSVLSADNSANRRTIDWQCEGMSLLWRYNLHYFDWLWSLDPQQDTDRSFIQNAIEQWWETSDLATLKVGWSPYPTSLRLLNWTLLFFGRWHESFRNESNFLGRLAWAIRTQQAELQKRLEFHLGANHLLENLVAICVVDDVLGSDSSVDRPRIESLLREQLQEQFLPDGCHYERSPMYHLRMLWLLDVLRRLRALPSQTTEQVSACYERGQAALCRLCHADGRIALLNDAAFDIYNGDLLDRGRCRWGTWSLPEAGYYGVQTEERESLIIDAGPIGPDHQPGHAHADTFSFEWSLDGERFITDTGVYDYEVNPFRLWTRSTEAHNSVAIDQRSSSEVWSGFRVGRRARVTVEKWQNDENSFHLSARHDGFFPQIHHRTFDWSPGKLRIIDKVSGRKTALANLSGYLHFAPETKIRIGADGVECRIGRRQVRIEWDGIDKLTLQESWYCPKFGVKLQRKALKYDFGVGSSTCTITLHSEVL